MLRDTLHTEVSTVDEMDYVRILRDLREDADKTQTQIAEVLGTSQTMYARYERGANELPIHHLILFLNKILQINAKICYTISG